MFPEMSLCFMAYCAAIKHLLGRQLIYQACLLFFSCSSHSLRGQIPSRCYLPICVFSRNRMNQNHSPARKRRKCACVRLLDLPVCAFYLLQGLRSSQFEYKKEEISQAQHRLRPRLHLSSLDSSLWICLTGVNIACWFQLEDKHRC